MKQKQLISDLMFRFVYEYHSDNGKLPEEDSYEDLAHNVYDRLKSRSIWVPYDEFYNNGFLKKLIPTKVKYLKSATNSHSD